MHKRSILLQKYLREYWSVSIQVKVTRPNAVWCLFPHLSFQIPHPFPPLLECDDVANKTELLFVEEWYSYTHEWILSEFVEATYGQRYQSFRLIHGNMPLWFCFFLNIYISGFIERGRLRAFTLMAREVKIALH